MTNAQLMAWHRQHDAILAAAKRCRMCRIKRWLWWHTLDWPLRWTTAHCARHGRALLVLAMRS